MPTDFPDMRSLERIASIHKFRELKTDESEDEYRSAIADHVYLIDSIESCEIRYKIGWDKWSEDQKKDMLRRGGLSN